MNAEVGQGKGVGLSFRLDAEAGALFASVRPDPAAVPIDEAWLRARLAEEGYGTLRYHPMAITGLLAQYNSGAAVAALKLGECVDASFSIAIAPDGLQALLTIVPAQGGRPVAQEAVFAELAARGVTEGILPEAITRAIAAGMADGVAVARGRPAVPGENGRLESVLPEARSRVPHLNASGQTDYRDLGDILSVAPGQPLMVRRAATAGTPGVTVFGQAIPAHPGKEVAFAAKLNGAQPDPEDPDRLLAEVAGQPVVVAGGMIVEQVYTVAEVNMATGNVSFDGSVVVRGDVAAGMTIRASGDIQIGGTADPCVLEAGGSISIKGGALGGLGRKEHADSLIRCGGTFTAAFAQQARIEAGDSIFIDDMAMQCDLAAGNHIRVGNKRRGHIIGGRALATLSISGKVLGSPNRIATNLEVGVSPATHKRMHELAKTRDGKEKQLLDISKLLAFAGHNPGRVDPAMVERARNTAKVLADEIQALRDEEQSLAELVARSQQARVTAEQVLHEGVNVQMGTLHYSVSGEHGAAAIGLNDGVLGLLAAGDSPSP
ncbi:DUF342 domain-containing protein [Pseudothauera rhizosphaerae]|uniref:DUF342 domain-containing protein n=2 Tax=Pseudothauera rhizosphaerae TaxID=2565932 RepID=A0A4S4AWC7_9RHOO|nr:DUF342 domain-containing protein [Pseudothauera rhizosphaerae]